MRRQGRLRHPAHGPFRTFCRVVGPTMLVGGFIMIAIGIADFTSGFGDFDKGPDLFWLAFCGMLVLMGGIALTRIGFLGAAARYVAGETAPVVTDTVNYVARGAKEGVREIVQAVRGEADRETVVRCHKCNADNDGDAKFCKSCGAALSKSVSCPECNELNDPDANFCDNCGTDLTTARGP